MAVCLSTGLCNKPATGSSTHSAPECRRRSKIDGRIESKDIREMFVRILFKSKFGTVITEKESEQPMILAKRNFHLFNKCSLLFGSCLKICGEYW